MAEVQLEFEFMKLDNEYPEWQDIFWDWFLNVPSEELVEEN